MLFKLFLFAVALTCAIIGWNDPEAATAWYTYLNTMLAGYWLGAILYSLDEY